MKIRITVEYDLAEGMTDGETFEQAVAREEQDWREGNVDVRDILACDDGMVKFELVA